MEIKFSEILAKNDTLKKEVEMLQTMDIVVLSNITVSQFPPILEYTLRKEGVNANVKVANYDNILQDSKSIKSTEIPIIFWEVCNVIESIPYMIELENEEFYNAVFEKISSEIHLLINNLSKISLVFFNSFNHLPFSSTSVNQTRFQKLCEDLNDFLKKAKTKNIILIDIDKPFFQLGLNNVIDWRGFYLTKSLYKIAFFQSYAEFISPYFLSISAKSKKVLVFDCDNTLWKGIVGEDGYENIALSPKDKGGIYFRDVHLIAKRLLQQGVVFCLSSKNNFKDVEEAFSKRSNDLVLNFDDFVIKKINWNDKSSNIKEIAKELNVGEDSIIFVDDSSFEINLVNEILPEVTTFQVPKYSFEYPFQFSKLKELFFSLSLTNEDAQKSKMYIQNQLRENEKNIFSNIDDYLNSLNIQLEISINSVRNLERVTQLINKTNQFNLTTKRYLIGQVEKFYLSEEFDVVDLSVSDKYGDSGLTGVAIIKKSDSIAEIDTLLLSCRILGRQIENAFISEIVKYLFDEGVIEIKGSYKKTLKNVQVELFFEENGFSLVNNFGTEKSYVLNQSLFKNNKQINKQNNIHKIIWKRDLDK